MKNACNLVCHGQVGPLISCESRDRLLELIAALKDSGAQVLCGGCVPALNSKQEKGFFIRPTILAGNGLRWYILERSHVVLAFKEINPYIQTQFHNWQRVMIQVHISTLEVELHL